MAQVRYKRSRFELYKCVILVRGKLSRAFRSHILKARNDYRVPFLSRTYSVSIVLMQFYVSLAQSYRIRRVNEAMYNDAQEFECVFVRGGGGYRRTHTHTHSFCLGFCFIKTKSLKFSLHINTNSSISTQILQFND